MKWIVVMLVSCMALETFAQSVTLKGGLNMADMLITEEGEEVNEEFKMNPGFHFGILTEFQLSDGLSFEPGLLLMTKGTRAEEEETYQGIVGKYEAKINLYYLDIPLNLKLSTDAGSAKIFGTFGPYIGMGLSGKSKFTYSGNGDSETEEEDIEWGKDKDLLRLDWGLGAGAGIEFGKLQLGVSYALGLANIAAESEDDSGAKNRVLSISVGYKFSGK